MVEIFLKLLYQYKSKIDTHFEFLVFTPWRRGEKLKNWDVFFCSQDDLRDYQTPLLINHLGNLAVSG
jgi:hypothetical protein